MSGEDSKTDLNVTYGILPKYTVFISKNFQIYILLLKAYTMSSD